ncbi:alpha/beta fold hydrolase [Tunturiibacter psychrotolerans]|uniref:thioesterase II family protein n=1 Tax=Tunturiibacter psychrotolerans TaxID=3069686 RepID=UPI003D9B6963
MPCAGRGAALYRGWPEFSGSEMELCAIQLPGRESRLREAPFIRMSDAVERAAEALEPQLDLPYVLFGHSMGAILCFELARLLRSRYGVGPIHLFVSARRAPQFADPQPPLHLLRDARFIAEINRRYNGLPREVLANTELMELLLPMLRADVQMIETYAYEPGLPLDCPITAFGGVEDSGLRIEDLEGWRAHTNSRFETKLFLGDHFFVQSAPKEVLEAISRSLNLANDFGSHRGFGR